jgi:hypothetical protein
VIVLVSAEVDLGGIINFNRNLDDVFISPSLEDDDFVSNIEINSDSGSIDQCVTSVSKDANLELNPDVDFSSGDLN